MKLIIKPLRLLHLKQGEIQISLKNKKNKTPNMELRIYGNGYNKESLRD